MYGMATVFYISCVLSSNSWTRGWNTLSDSLISSAEVAEDCVVKLTSLVRARD